MCLPVAFGGGASSRATSWRMSLAMFIATASLFLGQAKVFPKPIRLMPLLSIPVLLVLVVMLYWLVRLRLRKAPPVVTGTSRELAPLRGAA